jgi:hypothetical protein
MLIHIGIKSQTTRYKIVRKVHRIIQTIYNDNDNVQGRGYCDCGENVKVHKIRDTSSQLCMCVKNSGIFCFNAKTVENGIDSNCCFAITDNSLCYYFHFNISGLDVTESVLEAQLHLYRMRTPAHEIHPVLLTSPSLIVSTKRLYY